MGIQLIIDGYNFIGSGEGLSNHLDLQRSNLVSKLSSYQKIKNIPICIVFDGWKDGKYNQHFYMEDGIEIIYSRLGEKADQVIVRLIKQLKEKCVVVSSDREIIQCARQWGATSLTAGEFEQKLAQAISPVSEKLNKQEEDREEMVQNFGKKSGNPKRKSKRERTKQSRLKKL